MSFESAWEDHVEAWAAHVDGSPDSVPDPASASPEGRITGLLDVGESWLHVSARDVLGRWGPVTHVRLVVRDDPYALEVSAGESFWGASEIIAVCAADDGAGIGIIRPGGAAVRIADLTAIGEGRCSATWDPAETVDDVRLWPDGGYELVVVDAMGAELSDRVLVNVAALATAVDRLQADYEAGLVSAEDLGLGLLAGLTRPEELPERYAGAERGLRRPPAWSPP